MNRVGIGVLVFCGIGIISILIAIFSIHTATLQAGVTAAAAAYEKQLTEAEQNAYNFFYESNFDLAEKKYHVSSDVTIALNEIKEIAKLEVLEVSAVEYDIVSHENNNAKIDVWLEVPGRGIYTVDMNAAEYIVDNVRKTIIVRVPRPTLENVSLDHENIVLLNFDNTDKWLVFNNDDYRTGADIYDNQIKRAYSNILSRLNSDTNYINSAERSAEKMITHFVREFNRGIPELEISVEFIE